MAGTRAALLPRISAQRSIQLDAVAIARHGGAIAPLTPDAGGAPFPIDRGRGRRELAARQRQGVGNRCGAGQVQLDEQRPAGGIDGHQALLATALNHALAARA